MRLLRAQMPRLPEYSRSHRASMIPWVHGFDSISNTTFGGSPPASDAGDLIIVAASTSSTDIIPTTGTSTSFTGIDGDNSGGVATVALSVAFKVAPAANTNVGGFTNASRITAIVLKGAQLEDDGTVLGATMYSTTSVTTRTWPSLSLPGPRAILMGFQADGTGSYSLPAGFTEIESTGSPALVTALSDQLQTSWSGITAAQAGNLPSVTFAVAIRGAGGQFR